MSLFEVLSKNVTGSELIEKVSGRIMSNHSLPATAWNSSRQMYEAIEEGGTSVFDDFKYVKLLSENIGVLQTIRLLYKNIYVRRNILTSSDVARIYDQTYADMLDSQPAVTYVNSVPLNYYHLFAFNYLAAIPNLQNKYVLDLGCGTGDLALALASIGFTVFGIDFSRYAIKLATAKASRLGQEGNAKFAESGSEIPHNQEIDFVVLSDVVEHLSDMEIRDMLIGYSHLFSLNTKLVIHTPNGRNHQWCKERWRIFDVFYWLRDVRRRLMHRQELDNLLVSAYYEQVHINIMTPEMITRLLHYCGFKPVTIVFRDDTRYGLHRFGFSGSMGVIAQQR